MHIAAITNPGRRDPDHAQGGIDQARREQYGNARSFPAYGTTFADGIGGARSNGSGYVIRDREVLDAARSRSLAAIAGATTGVPALNEAGSLPIGVHRATWAEATSRFAGNQRRLDLFGQLRTALDALGAAGIEQAVIGGSLVTTKPHPGDVDMAFVTADPAGTSAAKQALAAIAQRIPDVHAYPVTELLTEAPTLGVTPGSNMLEFFQRAKDGTPRGVVVLPTGN